MMSRFAIIFGIPFIAVVLFIALVVGPKQRDLIERCRSIHSESYLIRGAVLCKRPDGSLVVPPKDAATPAKD